MKKKGNNRTAYYDPDTTDILRRSCIPTVKNTTMIQGEK